MNETVSDIFIITYGRSGSTLLQALLNTAPGVDLEGENFGFLYHLFSSWKALRMSADRMERDGKESDSHPFYGANRDYRQSMEQQVCDLAKAFLRRGGSATKVCGFKEVRHDIPDLQDYLSFLAGLCERPHFVFLKRTHKDVVASGFMRDTDPKVMTTRLTAIEAAFAEFAKAQPGLSTWIDYADLTDQRPVLSALFQRLGLEFHPERVAAVLSQQHSYAVKSAIIFMGHRIQIASRDALDPVFEVCQFDAPKLADSGRVTLSGLLLPRAGLQLAALSVWPSGRPQDAHKSQVTIKLPSPKLAKQYPEDPGAASARFTAALEDPTEVHVVTARINGSEVEIATYFPPPRYPQSRLFPPVAQTGYP